METKQYISLLRQAARRHGLGDSHIEPKRGRQPPKLLTLDEVENGSMVNQGFGLKVRVKGKSPPGHPKLFAPSASNSSLMATCHAIGLRQRPAHLGGNLWGRSVLVTPLSALHILLLHNDFNRPVRRSELDELVEEIKLGEFTLIPEGFCIRLSDGALVNGQHRLGATIITNIALPMVAYFNVSADAQLVIDNGVRRTIPDLTMLYPGATKLGMISGTAIRQAIAGRRRPYHTVPRSQVVRWTITNGTAARWIEKQFGSTHVPGITIMPVCGAILRAYQALPSRRGDLERFCEVLRTGKARNVLEVSLLTFRQKLSRWVNQRTDKPDRLALFGMTEFAIRSFFDKEQISQLEDPREEIFDAKWRWN